MEDRSALYRFFHNSIVILAIASIVVDYIVEALSRHDPVDAAMFMVHEPLVTLCNCMLIIAVLSLAMLFRRRAFAVCMFSLIWVALGITNCVILTNRMSLSFMTTDTTVMRKLKG